jgi:hypothetical protein
MPSGAVLGATRFILGGSTISISFFASPGLWGIFAEPGVDKSNEPANESDNGEKN